MNCQIFETVVNDLAREQMIEAGAREQALAHSEECEACALRLSLERRLTLGLRALAVEMKSVSASHRVEENLLEAFRNQTSAHSDSRSTIARRYWLAAAAAVVLLVFGVVVTKWRPDGPSDTGVETSSKAKTEPSPGSSPVASQSPNPESRPIETTLVNRPRRNQSVRRSVKRLSDRETLAAASGNAIEVTDSLESEVATQFLPLSYVSPMSLQEGGQLVRVELPRSAMARFGLPVNMERYGEKVKADVLVSADGLARAIRFVQ